MMVCAPPPPSPIVPTAPCSVGSRWWPGTDPRRWSRSRTSRPIAGVSARRAGRRRRCSTIRSGCSPRWSARSRAIGPANSERASWDEALGVIVAGIEAAQLGYGRDAVGCFGGGGLTNEKAYALGKFARVALRTAMIDYNGRFCMSSAATAANRAFGIDRGLPFPLSDLAETDAILLVGSNPGRHHAAGHAVVRRRAGQRGDPHRGRPTAYGDGRRLVGAPGPAARHRSRAGQRSAASGDQGRPDRPGLHQDPHQGVRRGQGRGRAVLAGPGRADHRDPGRGAAGNRAHAGRRPTAR